MVFGFYFKEKYTVHRRLPDGSIKKFTTSGVSRMEYSADITEHDFNVVKYFFLLTPELKILAGDIIDDGISKVRIGKVSELNDIDGNLCAYRCENA